MAELWKAIPGYEGYYEASTEGRIRSVDREYTNSRGAVRVVDGRVLSPTTTRCGYNLVALYLKKKRRDLLVHRLVAETFVQNPAGAPEVNHKDGNKQNNSADNLEWCTQSENLRHRYRALNCQPCDGGQSKPVRCIETGRVYASGREAARAVGCAQSHISASVRNPRRGWRGLHFEFAGGEMSGS